MKNTSITVWDIPTRCFHWLLVVCLTAQWVTAELLEGQIDLHFYIGYVTLGLVTFRLVWGFIGPKHAKFSSFLRGPKTTLGYLMALLRGESPSYVGHNPLGGLIVPTIIFIVATQAISGLFITDDVLAQGPYYSAVSNTIQDAMAWIHHTLFDGILIIAALHLLALIYYKLRLKRALVLAMITGKKLGEEHQQINSSKRLIAIVLLLIIAGVLYYVIGVAPPVPEEEFYF